MDFRDIKILASELHRHLLAEESITPDSIMAMSSLLSAFNHYVGEITSTADDFEVISSIIAYYSYAGRHAEFFDTLERGLDLAEGDHVKIYRLTCHFHILRQQVDENESKNYESRFLEILSNKFDIEYVNQIMTALNNRIIKKYP